MPVYQPLERFLNSVRLPLLTCLSDSDVYIKAAETGVSIFEMDSEASEAEREQFRPIAEWVERPQQPQAPRADEKKAPLRSRFEQAAAFLE
jgi:nitrogenase subunit NifH